MQRRDFCRFLAIAAASKAVPTFAHAAHASPLGLPSGFDQGAQDYAHFCALPESERTFSAVSGGQIVTKKLDPATWEPAPFNLLGKAAGIPDSWDGVPMQSPEPGLAGTGPYDPTWDSLIQYEAPEWYQDAKFGIWAHWSPQCVPENGDWYARNMYMEGSRQYAYHLEHYGHPSRFGYKDLCAQWTLLNWQPEELMDRYKRAGARFFLALANHHDGFDCWDSKHQPWNSQRMGPHRDVVGTWAKVARDRGMRFGVTVHQAFNWWFFQTSHGADKQGPQAGVSYDGEFTLGEDQHEWCKGNDPQLLYGPKHPPDALPHPSYVKFFYDRTRDLIDQHNPDLLYFDSALFPLGWGGMNIAAYYYNSSLLKNGKMEAVVNIKAVPANIAKAVVADYERSLTSGIMPYPWQSETCIGDWHYNRALYERPGEYGGYLPPRDIIHWLIDTVSKNGTFILNVPGRPDGTIDEKEIAVLDGVTSWMQVNGEAIYETRPWKICGEGPNSVKAGNFGGHSVSKLGPKDIRFTRNKANNVIYALVLGWPTELIVVQSLGFSAATHPSKVADVKLLGTGDRLSWGQDANGLRVELPKGHRPYLDYAAALKVTLA